MAPKAAQAPAARTWRLALQRDARTLASIFDEGLGTTIIAPPRRRTNPARSVLRRPSDGDRTHEHDARAGRSGPVARSPGSKRLGDVARRRTEATTRRPCGAWRSPIAWWRFRPTPPWIQVPVRWHVTAVVASSRATTQAVSCAVVQSGGHLGPPGGGCRMGTEPEFLSDQRFRPWKPAGRSVRHGRRVPSGPRQSAVRDRRGAACRPAEEGGPTASPQHATGWTLDASAARRPASSWCGAVRCGRRGSARSPDAGRRSGGAALPRTSPTAQPQRRA